MVTAHNPDESSHDNAAKSVVDATTRTTDNNNPHPALIRSKPALIRSKIEYAPEFGPELRRIAAKSQPWTQPVFGILLYAISAAVSTMADYNGLCGFFPGQPIPAALSALVMEGFVMATAAALRKVSRRALPAVGLMAILFGGTSVLISAAGFSGHAAQYQAHLDAPRFEHEDALAAQKSFAAVSAQTESAALGRITNELHFLTEHTPTRNTRPAEAQSGFARDQQKRLDDLLKLKIQWTGFSPGEDVASSSPTSEIWTSVHRQYAALTSLTAETNKLTSGGKPLGPPDYPAPPDRAASDARQGATDYTGLSSLRHPSLLWVIVIPLALIFDFGPMLMAASWRAIDLDSTSPTARSEKRASACSETPVTLSEDFAERIRQLRRVGDDLRSDPLAIACDAIIAAEMKSFRETERGALTNLRRMRSLELLGEECTILRDAAGHIGIDEETLNGFLSAALTRWIERDQAETEALDTGNPLRL